MKRFYILGVAMGMSAFLSSLFGCHVSDGDFRSLSVAEFKEYIADTAVVRLDVRTAEEYAERIKAAMKDFPSKLPERAYQDVLEIYNTDVMKKKYIAFYNDVINRKYER